jgi:hypothetical protein
MIAREGELGRIELGTMRDDNGITLSQRALTVDEQTELNQINAAWKWVKGIRDHSNVLEAEINALITAEEIAAWTEAEWPA